jgi:hypothetical protein
MLCSAASAEEGIALSKRQKEFERDQFAEGKRPGSGAFAARLAMLYKESLSTRATAIVEALKTVHSSFGGPLDEGVDAQLADWGARALADAYQGLEGAYARHLRSFGVELSCVPGLDHTYALAQATVANLPRRHLWELRNVPSRRPQPAGLNSSSQVTIHNSGTIGVVQTGAGSIANVQQQWIEGDTSALRSALASLRQALEQSPDVDPEMRQSLLADIDSAGVELQRDQPSRGKLLRWLGGIGASVGTLANIQPAYEAVKSLARALGIPL